MLDTQHMPDGMNEHRESVIVIGVDLTVCILGRIRVQGLAGEGTYLGMLRWTKIYLGRDGDDSFRYTGVRPSKPENLSKMGTLMDDDGVERYLCVSDRRYAQPPFTVHCHRRVLREYRPSPVAQRTSL